jgi:hypothetical protein
MDACALIRGCPVAHGVNSFHQVVDSGLAGRGPLGVVLADDLGRISKNVGDILKAGTAPQKLGRQRMTEAMRVRSRHSPTC